MEDISKIIGRRIRGFRKQKKLSQEALAEKCDLHPTYIGQLERGEKSQEEFYQEIIGKMEEL